MTLTENCTSATKGSRRDAAASGASVAVAIALATLAGLLLRSLRINWQPLWWDEGYSIFFATEPARAMLELTAADIHPPLYYALLHAWIKLFGSAQPAVVRYASVFVGALTLPAFGLLAHTFFPGRRGVIAIAVLLLAVSPMHIFYSQEVRMYSLALLLGVAATLCIVRLSIALAARRGILVWAALYVGSAALLMHTLYYGAFLIAGHLIWAVWSANRSRRNIGILVLMYALLALVCFPWWYYAAPRLISYVADKITSDQDVALTPWAYAFRHLRAFGGGHLQPPNQPLNVVWRAVPWFLILALWFVVRSPAVTSGGDDRLQDPRRALAIFVCVPALLAYGFNLRFPFFPEAGERLLLFILPYVLLLIAAALAPAPKQRLARRLLLLALLLTAGVGVSAYYTIPRYEEHDYRPVVAGVTQQGTDSDSVLALFPWQVGYWRSYTPQDPSGRLYLPQPTPVGQRALEWTPSLGDQVVGSLVHGALWFPEPRSLGSQLPSQIHDFLQTTAVNLVETWYSDATLLSAWAIAPAPTLTRMNADWGPVSLIAAGAAPGILASANQPVIVRLVWQPEEDVPQHVSLRLQDGESRVWAGRDYEPIGKYAAPAAGNSGQITDQLGLIVPAGLPPGQYDLVIGVGPVIDTPMPTAEPSTGETVRIAALKVVTSSLTLPDVRMPMEVRFTEPAAQGPARLLGFSGIEPGEAHLAGTELTLRLAYQSVVPTEFDHTLALSLVDEHGIVAAGYHGWPLPDYPVPSWQPGALVTVPATLQTRADLVEGTYSLYARLGVAADERIDTAVKLTEIQIVRRPTAIERGTPHFLLDPPMQFGSHTQLYGYDLTRQADQYHLVLYWSVLQPLLPPHHVFVHLDAQDGTTLAQADGPPQTAAGSAPSGSWLPGEQLTTESLLTLPSHTAGAELDQAVLRVGLYEPASGTRLPVSRGSAPIGDYVEIPIRP